jgi:hypothetical protein
MTERAAYVAADKNLAGARLLQLNVQPLCGPETGGVCRTAVLSQVDRLHQSGMFLVWPDQH